jgi:hypothetical protein
MSRETAGNKKDLNNKFQLGKLVRKCVILIMEALLNDPLLNKAAVNHSYYKKEVNLFAVFFREDHFWRKD